MLATSALAQLVELEPNNAAGDVTPELRYWGSITPDLGKALDAYRDGLFSRTIETAAFSAEFAPETWVAVELINTAPADGRAGDAFVMTLDAPLLGGLSVFLVRDGGLTENLMEYSIFAPFDTSQHAVTRLRTPIFELAPGEQVTLLAHAQMGPFPRLRMSLFTPETLTEAFFWWGVGHTAFYAFALACIVFFFGFQGAMRNRVGMLNAALFLAFLGLIALVDGMLFRILYPQHPALQSVIGFGLIFALSGMGFLLAGTGLSSAKGPTRLSRGISWMTLVSLAGFGISLVSPGPLTALLAYGLVGLMLLAMIPGAVAVRADPVTPHVGAVLISGLAVTGAVGVIVLVISGGGGAWLGGANAMRGVFAFLLLATMTFLTANVMALRTRHLSAVEARVVALEAEAQRSRELLEAERNYAQARDLAATRQRQLATASHDLKQPLMSLRMTFDTIAAEMQPEVKARLGEAFDYLGALAAGYVDDAVPEEMVEDTAEAYPLSIVLGTVAQMFEGEAAAIDLRLRIHDSSQTITVPPIPLMRIINNLVSNALKYTDTGRVVVGVRRGGKLRLCVIDTGPGLSEEDIATFKQAYRKGATSTGHGLGLSVCFELAQAHGMVLDVCSLPGKGTAFTLVLGADQGQLPV